MLVFILLYNDVYKLVRNCDLLNYSLAVGQSLYLGEIERSQYEAGAIEGIKSRWQELIYITIPSMGPQLMFAAVMQIVSSFTAGTVSQNLVGFPSTDYKAHTIMNHAYDYGWIRYEMGYASAICMILFIEIGRAHV